MKNNRIIKNSISKKLLIINITIFLIIIIITFISVDNILSNKTNTSNLISSSDAVYVDISQNLNLSSDNNESYINSLGIKYDINIAVVDLNGNIKLKTENINGNIIDITKIISDKLNTSGDSDKFNRMYNLRNGQEELILITSKDRNVLRGMISAWVSIIIPICGALLIIYLITMKKLKELEYICDGIVKIGNEDLNYKLDRKSNDEFGILVDEINKMSINLKNKIENEKNVYEFKNDFITNISHDLKTPLTSLIGYIQLAENKNTSENESKEYIKKALVKADRIQLLIEELFEYSKLESGEVKLEKNNINIIEMIEQCIGENSTLAIEKNLEIVKKYGMSELFASVDGELFIRVFENILGNAVKYSKNNTNIYIDVENTKESMTIIFKNTSNELINSDVKRLFERFYRMDKSRNQDIAGSGLGLYIAKSIVELHCGEIFIEGEGNNFKVFVKLFNE
ncbi:sensor histidine kinase [Clostridium sp.]|uniref:sensor histidine kinase n=1 Tax=Clostridium sp. TaxID=1506 RepID=UPI003F3DD162